MYSFRFPMFVDFCVGVGVDAHGWHKSTKKMRVKKKEK